MIQQGLEGQQGGQIRLLAALAEELRLPLLQILHKSQLADINQDYSQLKDIESTAETTLRLIDSYLFSTQVLLGQQQLDLQPVSVSAVLYDVQQHLSKVARLYNCQLTIRASKKTGLVMTHRLGLQTALLTLAYSFITASNTAKRRIILHAEQVDGQIRTGILASNSGINQLALERARAFHGRVKQPFSALTHNTGAGVYVADTLCTAMASRLQAETKRGFRGLALTLQPSHQLALL